ncbi:uncharacterized protein DNG_09489 [Cephalotrichum gorgonifer]|uniref:Uncharacterized protein n=1 Tax=Cephalotrichum gorgonifer TaxID=2041049 RepID=A0AAE8SZC2_9PEZI|nr:uncharacterized protein DNG_09489 [Cephalotrichum gorgonifer]
MQFSTSTLLSLGTVVSTLVGSVYATNVVICEHRDFGGACLNITPKVNECINLSSWWNDKLSSYKVQDGSCDFFRHANCVEHLWNADNRDDAAVGGPLGLGDHNDAVSSIRCPRSCCNSAYYAVCAFGCSTKCRADQGCQMRCAQDCCPEGVRCQ